MKTYRGSEGIAPLILNFGTRWRWLVSPMHWPLYRRGRNPRYSLDERLNGPQSRFECGVGVRNGTSLVQPVALSLYWLSCRLLPTYLLTYLLIYLHTDLLFWKADSHSACQTIACFLYVTRGFITVLTEARHLTLSWASQIQFAPSIPILQPTSRSF
jgi:hypothetical protein